MVAKAIGIFGPEAKSDGPEGVEPYIHRVVEELKKRTEGTDHAWEPYRLRAGDDLGGKVRRGTVQIVHPTGESIYEIYERTNKNTIPGSLYMGREKHLGRLLDGREHNKLPWRVS